MGLTSVAPRLLESPTGVRVAFNKLIQGCKAVDGEAMLKLVTNKLDMLLSIDNTESIELACLQSLLGSPGRNRLQAMVLEKMPSQQNPDISMAECRGQLEQLQGHSLPKTAEKRHLFFCTFWEVSQPDFRGIQNLEFWFQAPAQRGSLAAVCHCAPPGVCEGTEPPH